MKKHLFTLILVLGLSAAVALAQAGQAPSAAEQNPSQGSMQGSQAPDRMGASSQSSAQTQSTGAYGSAEKDNKSSSMSNVDDESLHRQVHEQLASNPDLQNVQITVKNGKVTLDGSVPKKQDKKEAERLAKSVPGVKGVKDHLAVNANAASSGSASNMGGVSGAATTTGSAQGENQSNQGIAAQSSSSSSTTGTATPSTSTPPSSSGSSSSTTPPDSSMSSPSSTEQSSTGTQSSATASTQSDQTSATAGAAAPSSTTPDQSSMGAQSQADASATGGLSGQATSQSSVPSAQESQTQPSVGQQTGSAGQEAGATSSSQSSMGTQLGTMSTAGSDDQLQHQIQSALRNDPTLANDAISVVLTPDTITISGEVASGKEKKSAQRIAESYAGNRKVKNEITVNSNSKGTGASPHPSYPSEKPPKQ